MNVAHLFPAPAIDGKMPVHDLEVEAATLTACMLDPDVAATSLSIASPDDYYSEMHRVLAKAIAHLLEAGHRSDLENVMLRLRETSDLRTCGGTKGVLAMMESAVCVVSLIERYSTVVHQLAQQRRLATTLHRVLAECYQVQEDIPGFLGSAEAAVTAVTRATVARKTTTALESAKALARELESPSKPLVTTGFAALDRLTNGFESSSLYILGARTSMGKTAMAMQMAVATAAAGHRVLVASMEMPRAQLAKRVICASSGVPLGAVKARNITSEQWSRIMVASSDFAKLPFEVIDTPGQTLMDIRAAARVVKPALLVVDHIGLMRPASGSTGAKRSREQEVAEFSRGLKALALETGISVLALCQVGRDVAKGARRPALSDLRESGAIEQDADGVWLIHRPGYYDPKAAPEVQRQAELIVAKQRDGETGLLAMVWDGQSATFADAPVAP